MYPHPHSLWWPRSAAFLLSALAAGSAVYWALKWPASTATAPAAVAAQEAPAPDPLALARALGAGGVGHAGAAAPPAPAVISAASRMALVGVVAHGARGGTTDTGVALISVDGKPARPYRVGAIVQDSLLLQSVGPRSAQLATDLQAPVSLTLELPQAKKP
jgi:general secretion pathway protein C